MATMKSVPDASTQEGADRKLMRVQAQAWREFFLSSPIPADNAGRRQWILQVQEHCDEYIIEDVLIGLSRDQKDNDRFFLSSAAVEALVESGLTPAEVEPFHFDPTIVERQYDRRTSGNDGTDEGNRVDGEPFKVIGYKSTSTKELLQTSAEGRRLGPISQGWFPVQLDAPLFGTTDRDPA